jgi:hypothetical protein
LNKHVSEAGKWDLSAVSAQLQFWDQLLQPSPDLNMLITLSRSINESIASAFEAYQRIFKLRDGMKSPQYLRMYAAFLSDVVCDEKRAAQALQQAQQCELSLQTGEGVFNMLYRLVLCA